MTFGLGGPETYRIRTERDDSSATIDHLGGPVALTDCRGNTVASHRRVEHLVDRLHAEPVFQSRLRRERIEGDFFQNSWSIVPVAVPPGRSSSSSTVAECFLCLVRGETRLARADQARHSARFIREYDETT